MRVLLASEAHFERGPGGSVYIRGPEDYAFWSSYGDGFDEVGVLARLRPVAAIPGGARRADGPGVRFHALDDYHGPWQYLLKLARLRRQARQAVAAGYDFFVLRAPGAVAYLAWAAIRDLGRSYAVEVLGDPWESLAPGRVASLVRGPARRWSRRRLARLCRDASVVRYVTRLTLQQRYPAATRRVFAFSDARVEPADSRLLGARLTRLEQHRPDERWQLGFAGSLETLAKGSDVFLRAVRLSLDGGLRVELSIAGDGRYRRDLERCAASLGLDDAVRFLGAVPHGAALNEFLDGIDLFVLPSYTEGLPKVLVEAMARGCPAIGSKAGGIPELLDAANLVAPGSPERLAAKLAEVLADPARLAAMALRNFAAARPFRAEALDPIRRRYLRELRLVLAEAAG